MEVEAKVAELDDMRQEPAAEAAAAGPERPETGEAPAPPADANGAGGPGPGWEAAERFFRRDA